MRRSNATRAKAGTCRRCGPARKLAGFETRTRYRIDALPRFLTHNDFRPANMHFEPSGRLVVLDWEAASLGPPGATLRFMARWPEAEQRQVVDLYCSHLAAKGIALRAEDVTFGMPASAVVQAVSFGAQQAGANRAPRKLKLLR